MVDECGCLEVWRDFSLIFSPEIWFNIYIGTVSMDLANGYHLCIYIYIYHL